MLFTGSIRHTDDPRLELTGESELSIASAQEEDSGEYQCRIMVETPLSVTHSLTVTNTFNIQARMEHSHWSRSSRYCALIGPFVAQARKNLFYVEALIP